MTDDMDDDHLTWLPGIHFGTADTPLSPLQADPDPDPDDEELAETPTDVIAMLGFDPRDMNEDDSPEEVPA